MYVLQRRTRLSIWTPAKLNLFLEVRRRRSDGYHDIETLMVPVNLLDRLDLSYGPAGDDAPESLFQLQVCYPARWSAPPIPHGVENLVMRALQLLSERSGHRVPTIVRLSKQIPAAAGLGGGSSDAAAALVGANRLWKLNWSRARLSELAAELGSDVPFFLHGGPAVCRGRGERIDPLPCLVRQPIVIVKPTASLATAAIYGQVRPADTSRPIEPLLAAWHDRNSAGVARHLFNRLQAPAEVACPQIGRIAAHLDRLPLLGHQLSGSGSAYFAICRSDRQARRIASVLHAGRLGQVYRVHSLRTPSFCLAP